MKRSAGIAVITVFCMVSLVLAGVTIVNQRLATVNGIITMQWTTTQEDNLDGFQIDRSMNGVDFFPILQNKIEPKGAGSTYMYEDLSAMKSTATRYSYHLVILGKDGSRNYVNFGSAVPGNGSISDIKRTWGSIKAMFR